MLQRVGQSAQTMRRLTAVLALAGACGGTVSAGINDAGVDAAPTAPVPYDATFGTDASGGVSNTSIASSGGNQSSSSSGASGGSLVSGSTSSSSGGGAPCTKCSSDSDCSSTCGPSPQAGYYWCCVKSLGQCASQSYACSSGSSSGGPAGYCPAACGVDSDCAGCPVLGGNAKNCCVMGICAEMTVCPLQRDSGAQSDAGACSPVLASDYDQSCDADTDCVGVGQVVQCPAGACAGCLTEAVNKGAAAQYKAAFSRAVASVPPGQVCNCPCEALAICRGGRCEYGFCSPSGTDTLPACADAGGRCSYTANTICNTPGPQNSCAYADEICCL